MVEVKKNVTYIQKHAKILHFHPLFCNLNPESEFRNSETYIKQLQTKTHVSVFRDKLKNEKLSYKISSLVFQPLSGKILKTFV